MSVVATLYGVTVDQVKGWVKKYSSELREEIIIDSMTEQEQKDMQALQKEVEELKKKLAHEQMKSFALETMADLAKSELGIDIRKNFGAKQPKR